ncbi:MAG: ABC transporter substrate-binding protein [Chlamydiales bacterium]
MAWIFCNTHHSPLSNKQLRKALASAIDRKQLTEICNQQIPCYSLLPPSLSLQTEKKPLHVDIKKAKTAYKQALQELGCSSLTLRLHFSHLFGEVSSYLKQQWKSILGLEIILLKAEWNEFLRLCTQDDYHLACYWVTPSYPSPYAFLEIFKKATHIRNHSRWENAEYQHLLTMAETQVDAAKTNHFLQQAEMLLNEHLPVIPLYAQKLNFMLSPTIEGIQDVADASFLDLRWISRNL